jgi:predicted permease
MWQEIRQSARRLLRAPGFTLVAVLTLALGIGANTAIFSIVNAVLLAPLPYPQPGQLVLLHERTPEFGHSSVAYPNYLDWVQRNHSFSSLAAYRGDDAVLAGGGRSSQPEHLRTQTVSANFFDTLGVKMLSGPGLSTTADRPNGAPEVVISYPLWQRRFGGDPHLVGQTIPLNGKSYEVVGILPRDFWFWQQADVYTPVGQYLESMLMDRQDRPGIVVVGRLKPGVTLAAAQGDMEGVGRQLAQLYPKADGKASVAVDPTRDRLVNNARPTLLLLLAAVGLVLLIACANVANLMLARSSGLRREMAVRAALGASGGRLARQTLTESILLGLAGGAAGVAWAWAAVAAAPALIPDGLPRVDQIRLDGPVLAFSLGAAVLSGLLFGLIPAWQSRRLDLQTALKESGRSVAGGSKRTQNALVIAEAALAVMLLAGAGVLLRSLLRLNQVNPGFETHHLLTMQVALAPDTLTSGAKVAAAHRALIERVQHLPGVAAAAETSLVPLEGSDSETGFWLGGGAQPSADKMHSALSYIVSPGYRDALQIPLLQGRFIQPSDQLGRQNVIVIDSRFAQDIFPGQNPVGQHVTFQFLGDCEIVGVVGHVQHWSLSDTGNRTIEDEFYSPIDQIPLQYMTLAGQGAYLMVRAAGAPLAMLQEVRTAVAGPNHDQPVYHVQTMDQMVASSLAGQSFLMALLAIFAVLALLLAAIGLYGVLAYSVAQRTQEIGIRMALGAERRNLLAQFVAHGLKLALAGTAIGLLGALAANRLLAAQLFGLGPGDPLTLGAVALLLAAVAVAASYGPARRAAGCDPMQALRDH